MTHKVKGSDGLSAHVWKKKKTISTLLQKHFAGAWVV